MSKPKTAFISYKYESDILSSWVEKFAKDLRQNGIDALLDKWEVKYGDSFVEYMESKIPDADYFLFIVSKGSITSIESEPKKGGAVKFEVQMARSQGIHGDDLKFVPIVYEKLEAYPKRLRGVRYADFSNHENYNENLKNLINDINGISPKPPLIGIGRLQYDTKTYGMLPAEKGSPSSAFLETFEPYVGFPFYSEESDYKTFWPSRANEDRVSRFNKILEFVQNNVHRKQIIALVENSESKINLFMEDGREVADSQLDEQLYTNLRMVLKDGKNEDSIKLSENNPRLYADYMKLENNFWQTKNAMPNMFFKIKIKHDRNILLKNCFVSISILGDLYDLMLDNKRIISNDTLQNYIPGTKLNIKLSDLEPEMDVTLKIWYRYIPLESRFNPKPVHFNFSKTKGIKIHALSADGIKLEKKVGMIADEGVYQPYLDCLDIDEDQ